MGLEKTLQSPSDCKEIQPVHPKGDQSWMFTGKTDAETEAPVLWPPDELTHWKRPWCWERLRAGGEGDNRGWDGWMASPTWWIWIWARSGRWWGTGKPGVLPSMGWQRVGHAWATEKHQPKTNMKAPQVKSLECIHWVIVMASWSGMFLGLQRPGLDL